MSFFKGKVKFANIELAVGGSATGFGEIPPAGRTYYVNNITGASGNDGLSWSKAVDQVNRAIVLAEAHRIASWGGPTTSNQTLRNRIVIQGTGTRYTPLTALPSFCDIIGVGATPFGNGSGIVVIGAVSGADGATGSQRGNYWYNIQFCAGGAYSGFTCAIAYRTTWELCTFGSSTGGAACAEGLEIVDGSGVVIKECGTVGHGDPPTYGFKQSGTGNFNNCIVEDCVWLGATDGYYAAAYLQNGTVVRRNTCIGLTGCGIRDVSTETNIVGNGFYTGNFCFGAESSTPGLGGITVAKNPTLRCIGNVCSDNGTGSTYVAIANSA